MTYEQVVEAARNRFVGIDVSQILGTHAFQINIDGKGKQVNGIFYIEIKDGRIDVQPYEYYDRNAIIHISANNFLKLIDGKLDAVAAFTSGKISVEGDIGEALELIKYLKY